MATFSQMCVLTSGGQVRTDERGRLPAYDDDSPVDDLRQRAQACGDPDAVLVAPQRLAAEDPTVLLSLFAPRGEVPPDGWVDPDDLALRPSVRQALMEELEVLAGDRPWPERRPSWFRQGWYAEVGAWVDTRLEDQGRPRTGPLVATKVWSLSAVLRAEAVGGPVWFKAACDHFRAEPALTRAVAELAPEHAPPLLASDDARGWVLLDHLAGAEDASQDEAQAGLGAAVAAIMARLQLASVGRLDHLTSLGVPRRGLRETAEGFDRLLVDSVELPEVSPAALADARVAAGRVHDTFAELAALGIPETLVHGDLHPGNVARSGDAVVVYDWSDAVVSHPFLDLVHLTRSMEPAEAAAATRAYTDEWRTAYPRLDVDRAVGLAERVNEVFQMVVFEAIYRAQEPASRWEMAGVVSRGLRRLGERFPGRD